VPRYGHVVAVILLSGLFQAGA